MFIGLDFEAGFFINSVGVLVAQATISYILFLHRTKEEPPAPPALSKESEKTLDPMIINWHGGSKASQAAVLLAILCAFCVTIRGAVAESFCFKTGGILEDILPPDKRDTCYSLVSAVLDMSFIGEEADSAKVQFSQVQLLVII